MIGVLIVLIRMDDALCLSPYTSQGIYVVIKK